jgi:hypothetical protein
MILEIERGSNSGHPVKNSLWKTIGLSQDKSGHDDSGGFATGKFWFIFGCCPSLFFRPVFFPPVFDFFLPSLFLLRFF